MQEIGGGTLMGGERLTMNGIGHRSLMRLISTDCRVHQLSVPIAAICILCGQIFMLMFVVSGNCTTFTPEFRRHRDGVWKDFTEKRCY